MHRFFLTTVSLIMFLGAAHVAEAAATFLNRGDRKVWIASAGIYDSAPSTHAAKWVWASRGWTGVEPGQTINDLVVQWDGLAIFVVANGKAEQVHPSYGDRSFHELAVNLNSTDVCVLEVTPQYNDNLQSRLAAFARKGCKIRARAYGAKNYVNDLFGNLEVTKAAVDDAVQRLRARLN